MIDLTIDQPYAPEARCECGDPECLGPADAVKAIVGAVLPELQSPLLKLVMAECCKALDRGEDPRKIAFGVIVEKVLQFLQAANTPTN